MIRACDSCGTQVTGKTEIAKYLAAVNVRHRKTWLRTTLMLCQRCRSTEPGRRRAWRLQWEPVEDR